MFAATLEELAGQLALLQPSSSSSSSSKPKPPKPSALLQRVLAGAPSDRLRAYAEGRLHAEVLQPQLPQQLDENLRLLGVLATEMGGFVRQLQGAADAAAAVLANGGVGVDDNDAGTSANEDDDDAALLMAAAVDGAVKEMQLIVSLRFPPSMGGGMLA